MYFEDKHALLEHLANLEEENLFKIHLVQEDEQALEAAKKDIADNIAHVYPLVLVFQRHCWHHSMSLGELIGREVRAAICDHVQGYVKSLDRGHRQREQVASWGLLAPGIGFGLRLI